MDEYDRLVELAQKAKAGTLSPDDATDLVFAAFLARDDNAALWEGYEARRRECKTLRARVKALTAKARSGKAAP